MNVMILTNKQHRIYHKYAGMPRCGNCRYCDESGRNNCFFGSHHPLQSNCSSWEGYTWDEVKLFLSKVGWELETSEFDSIEDAKTFIASKTG